MASSSAASGELNCGHSLRKASIGADEQQPAGRRAVLETVALRLRLLLVSLAAGGVVRPAAGSASGLQAGCAVGGGGAARLLQRLPPGPVCGAGGDRSAVVLDTDRAGPPVRGDLASGAVPGRLLCLLVRADLRSEEHTSELQSL